MSEYQNSKALEATVDIYQSRLITEAGICTQEQVNIVREVILTYEEQKLKFAPLKTTAELTSPLPPVRSIWPERDGGLIFRGWQKELIDKIHTYESAAHKMFTEKLYGDNAVKSLAPCKQIWIRMVGKRIIGLDTARHGDVGCVTVMYLYKGKYYILDWTKLWMR